MPHDFGEIRQQYPTIIAQMPEVFTAHHFILEFVRQNQKLYIEALYDYRDNRSPGIGPFQTVHKRLAELLHEFPNLVERNGDEPNSFDIWRNPNGCSRWRRIPAN